MTIRGKIPPDRRTAKVLLIGHAKRRIEDFILLHIQKDEERTRVWISYFGVISKTRSVPGVRVKLAQAIYAQAHVVASPAQLRKLHTRERRNRRAVGGAMVDRQRTVVLKEQPVYQATWILVKNIVRAPRNGIDRG